MARGWAHGLLPLLLLSALLLWSSPSPRRLLFSFLGAHHPRLMKVTRLPMARPSQSESHVYRVRDKGDGTEGADDGIWVYASADEDEAPLLAAAPARKGYHIYSDIDDTLVPACGHAGGIDRRFCRFPMYPGVLSLYKAVAGDYRKVTILSARPGGSLGRRSKERLTSALTLYFAVRQALRAEDRGAAAVKALVKEGMTVDMRFGRKEDCYLYITGRKKEAYARFGAHKAWNARQYQLDNFRVSQVRTGRAVFFGDNGQGDEAGALEMIDQGLITHAFIQKVNETKPPVVHPRVSYYRTSLLAAAQAYVLGIIDRADLSDVARAVRGPMALYCGKRHEDPTCEEYAALAVRLDRRRRVTRTGVGLVPHPHPLPSDPPIPPPA